jgi:nitroreductase
MFIFGRVENRMAESIIALAPEIAERKSVTNWTKQKISKDMWELLMEAARRAPSSWNHQPARYIQIQNEGNIKELSNAFHRTNKWAAKAAGLIVQVANPEDDDCVSGKDYYLYDCGLAMMSLVYQAQLIGLSCRQMIGWDETEVKKQLSIPPAYRVVVVTALGYPSSSFVSNISQEIKRTLTQQYKRYDTKHISSWEQWNGEIGHAEI